MSQEVIRTGKTWRNHFFVEIILFAILALLPLVLRSENFIDQITTLLIYSILSLGLHVVIGYTGLLHLGVAAFFAIGAYTTGILASTTYPFQFSFLPTLVISCMTATAVSLVLAAPTLRLRGDYLALVTLGFGEVVKISLRNLKNITNGTQSIENIPAVTSDGRLSAECNMYLLVLFILFAIVCMLKNLERSRMGRAWVALREDELAATCMGIDITHARLGAFAIGSALAGLAGSLYAFQTENTADPNAHDFSRSIMTLCCLILGGLGGIRGALLGTFLLIGFDSVLSPMLDQSLQHLKKYCFGNQLSIFWDNVLKFTSWRLMLFGFALILMMRFRPAGILPARRTPLEPSDVPAGASS
jgi:branched-chain amino acid transport system permease protein